MPNRASSKSSRSESAHPVSDTGAIKRQDTVDGSTPGRKQSQFSNNSALGKLKVKNKLFFDQHIFFLSNSRKLMTLSQKVNDQILATHQKLAQLPLIL